MTQAWVLYQGGSIGFSSLESLRILEDISVLEPTFLATTPSFLTHQILDRRLQFLDHFSSFKSPIETYLLNKAIDQKLKMLKAGFGEHIWLWDRFVLGYLRDQLGGRLKW
jgi:long-chain acyl-CoA synthetase